MPIVSPDLRPMDPRLFSPRPFNLKAILESKPAKAGPERLWALAGSGEAVERVV